MSNQAARRTSEAAPLVKVSEGRHGLFMYFPHDQYIGRSLDLYGEYAEGETRLLASLLKKNDIVVEAGANLGAVTVPLARAVGLGGRVFAFEPQRIVFHQLCGNLALNLQWQVFATRAALGAARGLMSVPPVDYARPGNFGGVSLLPHGGEPAEVYALDEFKLERLALLKIDVEGMEAAVLRGAAETVKRCRPLLYVENDRPEKSEELVTLLRGYGYELRWHLPPLYEPQNWRGLEENVFDGDGRFRLCSFNMLGVPSEKTRDGLLAQLLAELKPVEGAQPPIGGVHGRLPAAGGTFATELP